MLPGRHGNIVCGNPYVCICFWVHSQSLYVFTNRCFKMLEENCDLCCMLLMFILVVVNSVWSWRIRDQFDGTSYYVLFHFFSAQHVSDINTSIIRSLRLLYCITTLVVCSCFDVCWSFGVAGLGWYPCSRLKPATRIYAYIHLRTEEKRWGSTNWK